MAEIRRIVHRLGALAVLAAILLSGCASPEQTASAETSDEVADLMQVRGFVFTGDLSPLAGANVTVLETNETVVTDATGFFSIVGLDKAFYTVRAQAPDHAGQTLTATPQEKAQLRFVLTKVIETPRHITTHYAGKMQCGAEYVIISGSCDRASTTFDGPSFVESTSVFQHPVEANWASIVVDVVWEEADTPLLEGLRVTTKAITDDDALTSYEQYGRFSDSSSFTFRIEPGGEYEDGTGPVPANATWFEFDVFPQGHTYHTVCTPANALRPAECYLGVGATIDLRFDLYVTTFYVEKAPQGFTVQ